MVYVQNICHFKSVVKSTIIYQMIYPRPQGYLILTRSPVHLFIEKNILYAVYPQNLF